MVNAPYRWRVSKAEQFLSDAESAFGEQAWETCVPRCYYAAYHLMAALLESRGGYSRQQWRHERLIGTFATMFSRKGYLFSTKDEQFLRRLLRDRYGADYHDVRLTQARTRRLFEETRRLCRRLLEVVQNG